ncbi:hydrogenase maturation factor HypE [Gottschalkia acidurici 9a]|uniref:Hydrogenase maturation factor HypE n=2 Tax=Clostridium acidurici TaxID=1556 RepID=K0AUA7_GOTA9|nr:hydrogenase maturation factor HypE [Gottschalkia acidurici 9a]
MEMEIGKVPNEVLEKLVFSNIKNKREEVLVSAGIGKDCAVLDFEKYGCVVSTDPITGATHNIGSLAINISCNDIASSGAEPIGVLMTILVPPKTTEAELEDIMRQAGETSKKLNIEIIGGHTEVTDAVNRVVITTTVIGRQLKENVLNAEESIIGDKILITKSAGIEGTAIIANELKEKLEGKVSVELLEEAIELNDSISVVKEGMISSKIGVRYMHDITEGGVMGAIWEASKATGKGVLVNKDSIPLKKSTIEICKVLDIDPYRLISSGSMLIVAPNKNVDILKEELKKENIECTVIGEIVEDGIKMKEKDQILNIDPPGSDELYKVI